LKRAAFFVIFIPELLAIALDFVTWVKVPEHSWLLTGFYGWV